MFSNWRNKWKLDRISVMLILSLLGGYFLIHDVTLFHHLFCHHMVVKHQVLGHFLTCTPLICWKFITRIIKFFLRTWFLSTVAVVIIKAKHIQTFWKPDSSFSLHFCVNFTPKMIGINSMITAAWSQSYKAREAALCIQRESDQERKGVLYTQLPVVF